MENGINKGVMKHLKHYFGKDLAANLAKIPNSERLATTAAQSSRNVRPNMV